MMKQAFRKLARSGCAITILICSQTSQAQVLDQGGLYWINPSGGASNNPFNWNPNALPTGIDTAIFELKETYTVQWATNTLLKAMVLTQGKTTFDLNGNMLEMSSLGSTTPGLIIGDGEDSDAELTIANGTVRAYNIGIADNGNSITQALRGRVMLDGPRARLEATGSLNVGTTGNGSLSVTGGAQVDSKQFVLAWEDRSTGIATVTGPGTSLVAGSVVIGRKGIGSLLIDNGASFQTSRGVSLGRWASGDGTAVVRGSGSRWEYRRDPLLSEFLVGYNGTAALGVLDGGTVDSDEPIIVGSGGTLFGQGRFVADVRMRGTLAPGGDYDDLLHTASLTGAGLLEFEGPLAFGILSQYQVEIGGLALGTEYDSISVAGDAIVGGQLGVTLIDRFAPSFGQQFQIISADSLEGVFTSMTAQPLGPGLSWQVAYSQTGVILSVVPAPSGMLALAVSGGALCSMRRRRAGLGRDS